MDNNSEVVYLYLDDIIPNRFQPREVFDDQALKELAVSIREHGVIQPIIVRKVDNKYEIIAGERRYKASTMAGLTKIPAIVKNLDDKESSKVALIENLQRKDLSPIEEARTYQKILELENGMTQEELAATMGKTQSSVSNKLRLLALPDEIQDALLKEKISERHARSLLNLEDKNDQIKMLDKVISEKMTVRELDKQIKDMKENKTSGGNNMNLENNENNINTVSEIATNVEPKQQENTSNNNLLSASDVVNENSTMSPSLNNLIEKIKSVKENQTPKPTFNLASFGDDTTNSNQASENKANNETQTIKEENPTVVDINKIRENSVDIGTNANNVPDKKEETASTFKFVPSFSLKTDNSNNTPPLENKFSKFFNPNTESSSIGTANNSQDTSNVASAISQTGVTIPNLAPNKKDVSLAVNEIKKLVTDLETKGYKVGIQENDGVTDYKITINLQKNA